MWFRHVTDALRNRKIRKAFRSHGAVAYAIYFAILEDIYKEEDEFRILADELWLEDLADDLRINDYRILVRVLDTFAENGLIDRQMWEGEHAIYIPAVVERGDQYLEKRAKEAEKKRRQREVKKREAQELKETLSPGDSNGTSGQSPQMSPSDPYSDPSSNSKPNSKPETKHDPDSEEEPGVPLPNQVTKGTPSEGTPFKELPLRKEEKPSLLRQDPFLAHMKDFPWVDGRRGRNYDYKPEMLQVVKKWLNSRNLPADATDQKGWLLKAFNDENREGQAWMLWDECSQQDAPPVSTPAKYRAVDLVEDPAEYHRIVRERSA